MERSNEYTFITMLIIKIIVDNKYYERIGTEVAEIEIYFRSRNHGRLSGSKQFAPLQMKSGEQVKAFVWMPNTSEANPLTTTFSPENLFMPETTLSLWIERTPVMFLQSRLMDIWVAPLSNCGSTRIFTFRISYHAFDSIKTS